MFSHSIICRNCSVVVSESDDVELLLEMANELDCPECGSPELAVEDFEDGEDGQDRCEECNSTHVEDPPEEWSHVLGLHCLDCGHVQM